MSQFVYIPESDIWTDKVRMVQTKDPVLGGKDGPANWAAQDLTNRTLFLKKAVEAAQTSANTANTAAKNADTKAGTAQTTANQAKTAATNAQKTADDAKSAAATADGKAVAAQTSANAANTAAKNADTKAANAQTTANQAKTAAATAQTAADDAKSAAAIADSKAVAAQASANAANTAAKNAQSAADQNSKEIEKKVDVSQVKKESLVAYGLYTSPTSTLPELVAGDFGLTDASKFKENNPGLDFTGIHHSWLFYEVQQSFTTGNLVATFKGYTAPYLFQAIKRAGQDWSKPVRFIDSSSVFSDKTGFLKDKNNNINAMIAADLLQKLSDSTTEAVSAKVVNDVNRKAVNAETIGINADAKAVTAQKKADQVPEPKAKNFVVGSNTTSYELMTPEQVKTLLNVPAAAKLYSGTGQATDGAMTQKGVTDAINAKAGIKLGEQQVTPGGYGGYSYVPENCVVTKMSGLYEGGGNIGGIAYYRPIIQL